MELEMVSNLVKKEKLIVFFFYENGKMGIALVKKREREREELILCIRLRPPTSVLQRKCTEQQTQWSWTAQEADPCKQQHQLLWGPAERPAGQPRPCHHVLLEGLASGSDERAGQEVEEPLAFCTVSRH